MDFTLNARKKNGKATTSRSSKAGLQFPVGRVHRHLRIGRYAKRIGVDAPVYLAAVLEYLTAEILELSGNKAHDSKPPKKRIIPRHIQLAILKDEELKKLLGNAMIAAGGVEPKFESTLKLKKKLEAAEEVDENLTKLMYELMEAQLLVAGATDVIEKESLIADSKKALNAFKEAGGEIKYYKSWAKQQSTLAKQKKL